MKKITRNYWKFFTFVFSFVFLYFVISSTYTTEVYAAACVANTTSTFNECECTGSKNLCATAGNIGFNVSVTDKCSATSVPTYTCGAKGAACTCPGTGGTQQKTCPDPFFPGQTNPVPRDYNECTNAKSFCTGQFGLNHSIHVHENANCSYICGPLVPGPASCPGSNAGGGTTPPPTCKINSDCTGGICKNGQCVAPSTSPGTSPVVSGTTTSNPIIVSPATLTFTGAQDTTGTALSAQNLTVTSTTDVTAVNEVTSDGWLLVNGASGGSGLANFSLTANQPKIITVAAIPNNAPGTYNGTLTFHWNGQTVQTVKVTLTVTQAKVAADTGFRILGVSSTNIANPNKTGTITLNTTSATGLLASSHILGASSYTASGNFTYDPAANAFVNHNLNLGTIPAGNYLLAMHVDGNLDAQMTQDSGRVTVIKIVPGQKVQTDIVNMIPGDVSPGTGDNFIDIIDFNKLVDCQGKPIAGTCKNDDLNDDGKIDQGDIDLLMLHFGSLGYSLQKPGFSCVMDPACQSGQQALQLCTLVCTRNQ